MVTIERSVLDAKWTRLLGTVFTKRAGKSIFNTEHTMSINQHNANEIKAYTKKIDVPISFGYVSHARDMNIGSKVRSEDVLSNYIKAILIDVEYMNFIAKISDHFSD